MSKQPLRYFPQANPLGQRSDAPGWVFYTTVLFLAMISFSPEGTAAGYVSLPLGFFAALNCQKYRSYLPVVFVAPASI